jgi:hypothetical protein
LAAHKGDACPAAGQRNRGALHGDLQRRLHGNQETRTCPVTLTARVEQRQVYGYYCVGGSGVDPASVYNCNRYPAPQCTVTQSYPINLCDPYFGIYWGCNSGDLRVDLVSCTAPVDGATPYTVTGENVVTPRAMKASVLVSRLIPRASKTPRRARTAIRSPASSMASP